MDTLGNPPDKVILWIKHWNRTHWHTLKTMTCIYTPSRVAVPGTTNQLIKTSMYHTHQLGKVWRKNNHLCVTGSVLIHHGISVNTHF